MKPNESMSKNHHDNGNGMEPLPVKPEMVALFKYLKTESPAKIIISTVEDTVFLEVEEIVHVSGSSNYSTFYLTGGEKIMASKGLKYFEDMLPENRFFRSHQSHLINLRFLKRIWHQDGVVVLSSGEQVPLARTRKNKLLDKVRTLFKVKE